MPALEKELLFSLDVILLITTEGFVNFLILNKFTKTSLPS